MIGSLSEDLISSLETYTRPHPSVMMNITVELERHTFLILFTLIILHHLSKERALLGGQRLRHGSCPPHSKHGGPLKMVI